MTWTQLTTMKIDEQLAIRLRFGKPVKTQQLSETVTSHWLQPGQVFAVSYWARLSPRKQTASFAVVEALDVGAVGYRLPCIEPAVAVHVFLKARPVGRDRGVIDRAEALIRRIEDEGIDPASVPPVYYRAAGQSLRVKRAPRLLDRRGLRRFERSNLHAK